MKAPILDFSDQLINEELDIFICNNRTGLNSDCLDICGAQILKKQDVKYLKLESVSVEVDDCMNVYDEPSSTVTSSAIPVDGNPMHCLKCDEVIGVRSGSHIVFQSSKLREMTIYSFNRLICMFASIISGGSSNQIDL